MRAARLSAILCLLISATLIHADDFGALLDACGKDATIETKPPSDYTDGLWHRTVEYKSGGEMTDWAVVGFTSHSRRGPWRYDSDFNVSKLSCLAASGFVAEQPKASISPAVSHSSPDTGTLFVGFVLVILLVIAYIFPAALATHRNCKARAAIVIVDLFLGWTFVGWVVALAWAASGETLPGAPQAAKIAHEEKIAPAKDMREPWFPPVHK